MKLGRLLAGSVVLLGANVLAGLANYFFQLRAAAELEPAAYGALNVWMAVLSIALLAGVLAQMAANFRPVSGRALLRISAATVAVAVVSGAAVGLALAGKLHTGLTALVFVVAVVSGAMFQFVVGHLQAYTRFGFMGLLVLVGAGLKIAMTYVDVGGAPETRYYAAFALSFAFACVLGAVLLAVVGRRERATGATPPAAGGGWGATVVLAAATTLLPQLDLLNLRGGHDDLVLGLFARASLFSKALYFGALTLVQVTLPFHLRHARGEGDVVSARRLALLERLGVVACVTASLAFVWLAPPLARVGLGIELSGEQRTWVVLSCLSLTALFANLARIQLACALSRPRLAAVRLGLLALTLPVFALVTVSSVTTYLVIALAWYVIVAVVFELRGLR